jgi:hypothetical protein
MNAAPVPTEVARTGCGGFTDDTENLPTTCRQSNSLFSEYRPSCKISVILSQAEFRALAHHLHNGNGPNDFGMGIAHPDGSRGYYAAKYQRFEKALASAWDCIVAVLDRPFAVTVYATNRLQMSCWAGFDIDAHIEDRVPHAEWVLRNVSGAIRRKVVDGTLEEQAVLVEKSGRGFHVWLISPAQRHVTAWKKLLSEILTNAGIDPKRDGVETYPSGCLTGLGRGFRLPGTANINAWNPADGTYPCSMILAERGLMQLIARLPQSDHWVEESGSDNKRGSPFIITSEETSGGRTQAQPKPLHEHPDAKRILELYAITSPSSRHNQLLSLVGDGFYHFSKKQLRCLAKSQYKQASPSPSTAIDGHLIDFEEAYAGMLADLANRLSDEERGKLGQFKQLRDKEAFIIAQNFARHAAAIRKWGADAKFPFSGLDLAARIGENTQIAYRIRKNLIKAGCIRKVEECRPGKAAEKYVWLLCISETAA